MDSDVLASSDASIADAPIVGTPIADAPADNAPADNAPVDDALANDAPVDDALANAAPADDALATNPALWTEVRYVNKARGHFVHDDQRPRQVLSFFVPHLYALGSGRMKYPDGHEENVAPWSIAHDTSLWQCLGEVGVKPESFGNKLSGYDADQENVVIDIYTASLIGLVGDLKTSGVKVVWECHSGLISGMFVSYRKDQAGLVSAITTAAKSLRRATIHQYIVNKTELNAQGEMLDWFMKKVAKERRRAAGGVRPDEIPKSQPDQENPPCPPNPTSAEVKAQ